jgi:hypothetical protein
MFASEEQDGASSDESNYTEPDEIANAIADLIADLEDTTCTIKWAKEFIDNLPVDTRLHEACLNYATALAMCSISIHGLNRNLFLAEQAERARQSAVIHPIECKESPTFNDLADNLKAMMKSRGITTDQILQMIKENKEAKGGTSGNRS